MDDNLDVLQQWGQHVLTTIKKLEEYREKDKKEILDKIDALRHDLNDFKFKCTTDTAERQEKALLREQRVEKSITKLKVQVAVIVSIATAIFVKGVDFLINIIK